MTKSYRRSTLHQGSLPLIRYRTGDIVGFESHPCRAYVIRMAITGRCRIHAHHPRVQCLSLPDRANPPGDRQRLTPHYQIMHWIRAGALDKLEVQVEVGEGLFFDEMKGSVSWWRRMEKLRSAPEPFRQSEAGGAQDHHPVRGQGEGVGQEKVLIEALRSSAASIALAMYS